MRYCLSCPMFARRLWDTLSSLAIPRKVEDAYDKDQNTVITETVAIDSATLGLPPSNASSTIELQFLNHTDTELLLRMSERLRAEMKDRCETDANTMLPSYISHFATTHKPGEYLSLEVGGSTLRAAIVQLPDSTSPGGRDPKVLSISSRPMSNNVKNMSGTAFFRWIAQQAVGMLKSRRTNTFDLQHKYEEEPLAISLTWSFPFEQIAIDKGIILRCGKGSVVFDSLIGAETSTLVADAFQNENISTRIISIVNDVVASLLAGNYVDPLVYCSVVLGTGLNAAVPVSPKCLSSEKFPQESTSLLQDSRYVLVNTELSLLGQEVLPRTRWDERLVAQLPAGVCHQPLEYLCSGYYLGEIVRLVLLEGIDKGILFSEGIRTLFERPFSFESSLVAIFEEDDSPDLANALAALSSCFGMDSAYHPSLQDLRFIQKIARCVSRRAAAYMAVCIHALCNFASKFVCDEWPEKGVPALKRRPVNVSGAVFEKYPQFKETCEEFLLGMTKSVSIDSGSYTLRDLPNCTTIGTAVAAAATCGS